VSLDAGRLSTWKPGHNITFCPDENKMIDTNINSVLTLVPEFNTPCKPFPISQAIDRYLQHAWDYANKPDGDPSAFVTGAKSQLGWYYEVCTDHVGGLMAKKDDNDLKDFLEVAAILTGTDMAIDDPANASTYKERAAKYKRWRDALYEAESRKSWWQRFAH